MSRRSHPCLRAGLTAPVAVLALAGCTSGSGHTSAPPASTRSSSASTAPATSAAPSVTPTPSAAASADCAEQQLGTLSLRARAGQLLMIGIPAKSAQTGASVVRHYRLGGMFLSGRSSGSLSTIRSRTDALRSAAGKGAGLLVATDQEGGAVQVLRGSGFTHIPAALTQGSWSTARLEARTRVWAAALSKAGISMDLAPVADTVTAARAENNPPIGAFHREYGQNTQDVERAVTAAVQGLAAEHVLATVKHFPGLGRVRFNTDTSSHAVDSIATAGDIYLQPFLAGIRAGAGAVMISSASYPELDPHSIAAFSRPIITGLLRERLGYSGVVISDDLGQARAVTSVPAGQRAVRFVRAGGDIVLSVRTSDARVMRDALVAEAKSSASFKATLDAAVVRVLELKQRTGLLSC